MGRWARCRAKRSGRRAARARAEKWGARVWLTSHGARLQLAPTPLRHLRARGLGRAALELGVEPRDGHARPHVHGPQVGEELLPRRLLALLVARVRRGLESRRGLALARRALRRQRPARGARAVAAEAGLDGVGALVHGRAALQVAQEGGHVVVDLRAAWRGGAALDG